MDTGHTNAFIGTLQVQFVNGLIYEIDVVRVCIDANGHPLWLVSASGTNYNWFTILAFKNISNPEKKAMFN